MTIESTELFELCKQVYEATGWKQSPNISQLYEYWDDHDELCVISIEDADDALVPAYTSDYILEKLPKEIWFNKKPYTIEVSPYHLNWLAVYSNGGECPWGDYEDTIVADTPLKALLKLVLKLHEKELL